MGIEVETRLADEIVNLWAEPADESTYEQNLQMTQPMGRTCR